MQARHAIITALDFETTGAVEGFPEEPWQLGMVRLRRGKVAETFETWLRVGDRPFHPRAPGSHHRVRKELAVAPRLPEMWPDLKPWWRSGPLAAHQAAADRRFVLAAAPLHRFGPWIDTLRLARHAWPGLDSYALEDLLDILDLHDRVDHLCPGRAPHDALFDATACAVLLEHLLHQPGWEKAGVDDLAGI